MDLAARFPSPLAAAAAAAAAGQNVASASTASSLFPYLFSNRNLHNYWLSTMKGMNSFKSICSVTKDKYSVSHLLQHLLGENDGQ